MVGVVRPFSSSLPTGRYHGCRPGFAAAVPPRALPLDPESSSMTFRDTPVSRRAGRFAPLAYALSLTLASGLSAPREAEAAVAGHGLARLIQSAAPAVVLPDDLRPRSGTPLAEFTPADEQGRAAYIVMLRAPALAAYDGNVPGLARIPQVRGNGRPAHLDSRSSQAQAYVAHLRGGQDRFVAGLSGRFGRQVAEQARFQHALNAVVLRLTGDEADALRSDDEVQSVQRERRRQLRTYDTPAFIGATAMWNDPVTPYKGEGIVIGVIDTGINYRSHSVKGTGDDGYAPVNPLGAGTFLGTCVVGGADAGRCNNKLIGMYSFDGNVSGQDLQEHGSHTASTAGGNMVNGAAYSGGSFNVAGIAPHANLITYDGCGDGPAGCSETALLNSINQAVADSIVDVINYSIGGPNDGPWLDPGDQAFLNAANAGIVVVTSAGNDGPNEVTTDSYAPWYTSVAATSPRGLPGFLLTAVGWGGSATLTPGSAPAPAAAVSNRPLIQSPTFANGSADGCAPYAANTFIGAGNAPAIAVLRLDQNASNCGSTLRRTNALNAGAAAVVFVDPEYINLGASGLSYSMLLSDWNALKAAGVNVTNGTGVGSISFPLGAGTRAGDILTGFSSRGPTQFGTLKPDLAAPGDVILAAISPATAASYPNAATPNLYGVLSGTSMASPHVAGAAALVRQARPAWSPHEVKSALMSTALSAVTLSDGSNANPNQRGAGRIDPSRAAKAGFVLDETGVNFQAANPATGGNPATLNLASYFHANCIGTCAFPRTLKSTGKAATWTLSVSGLPAGSYSLSTAMFTLGVSGSQAFTFTVDSSQLSQGDWYYGDLTLTPSDNTIPTAHFPIAVRGATAKLGVTPDPMTVSVQTGTSTTRNLAISNTGNPLLNWSISTTTLEGSVLRRPVGPNQNGLPDHTLVTTATATALTSASTANSYGADWFEILTPGTTLAELEMSGFGYDSVNVYFPPISSFATQFAFRVWGDNAGVPNGRPGNTVAGDQNPLFQWPAAAGGAPVTAPGLSFSGDRVRLDLSAAGVSSPALAAGRYWLNLAPSIDRTAADSSGLNFYQLMAEIPGKTPIGQQSLPNANGGANNKGWKPTTTQAALQYTGYAMDVVVNAVCGAPWMSYSSTSGALGTTRIADVTVTLNSAALAAGTYRAYLCVSGNGTSPPSFLGGQDSFLIPVTLTVAAGNANDAPLFTNEPYAYSIASNAPNATAVGTLTSSDPDGGQTRAYSIFSGNTGNAFAIDATTGAITVANSAAVTVANSPFALRVRVTDNGTPVLNDEANVTVTVQPLGPNTPPSFSSSAVTNATEDAAYTYNITTTDADVGATLTLTAPVKPAWLTFNATNGNGTLGGTPTNADVGAHNVTLRVTDGIAAPVDQTFVVTVANANDAPGFTSIATTAATEDAAYSYAITTADIDAGASLTLTAPVKPAWLTLNAVGGNGTLGGTPTNADVGAHNVTLRVSDGIAAPVDQVFIVTVANTNDAPTVVTPIGNQSNAEGNVIALNVAGNFADVDTGQTLGFSATGLPGGLSISAAGAITGTVSNTAAAGSPYAVTVTANDGNGGTVGNAFSWAISNTNQAPTVANAIANQTHAEGAVINLDLSTVFADADSDPLILSHTAGTLPPGMSLVGNAITGTLTLASEGSYLGITITASDGNGGTIGDTFDWSVTATNQAPTVATPIANQSDAENEAISLNVAGNFNDADGNTLTFSATGLPPALSISAAGLISGTLTFASAGDYTVEVTANDGNGGTISDTFDWSVTATNQAPTVATPIANQSDSENEAISLNVAGNFNDADSDTLSFSATGLPPALSINSAGVISGTLTFASAGDYTVEVTANDGNGGTISDTFDWSVTATNQAPTVSSPIANQSDTENEAISLNVAGNFNDADSDPLSFSATGLPPALSINSAGVISGTLTFASAGNYTVEVTANDGNGGTISDTFDWSVTATNQAPTVSSPIANQSDTENEAISLNVAGNFSDADNDTLSFSATGLPPALSINSAGVISGTLTFASAGNYTVEVTANDGNGGTISDTFDWSVTATNQAPTVSSPIANQSDTENEAISLNVAGNFNDADSDTLSFSATGLPPALSISAAGLISGTLTFASAGDYTVEVTANDGNGGTISDAFDWSVTATNQAPTVATPIANQSDSENEAISLNVAGNFNDADSNPLSFSATGLPPALSISAAGVISGTLTFASAGDYTVEVTANDGNGGTISDTFDWSVTATNQAPTISSPIANQSDTENEVISLNVAANFNDADSDTLSFSATGLPPALSISPAGLISGTLTFASAGDYTVEVTANDGNGGTISDTFDWTVAPSNRAPTVATPIPNQNSAENAAISLNVAGNFADADSDALTFSATGLPAALSINAAGLISGTLTFASAGDYTVQVTANDGNGGTVSDSFDWTVSGTNRAPTVATPIANQTSAENAVISLNVAGNFADADGNALTFSATGLPPALTISPAGLIAGSLSFVAAGSYTVNVTANDGNGGTITDSFDWTVTDTNRAPGFINEPYAFTVAEAAPASTAVGTVASTDADAGDTAAYALGAGNTGGAFAIDPATGAITVANAAALTAGATFDLTVTVQDAGGLTDTTTVSISVIGGGPVGDAIFGNGFEGGG
jgi:hypothetical protein